MGYYQPKQKTPVTAEQASMGAYLLGMVGTPGKVAPKDVEFVSSIAGQAVHKKELSEKQAYWLDKLAKELGWGADMVAKIDQQIVATAQAEPEFEAEPIQFPEMTTLKEWFATAGLKLKRPKLTLMHETVDPGLKLWVAGQGSKHPGSINVASPEPFEESKFYGRIIGNTFVPYRKHKTPDGVIEMLFKLAKDPLKTIVEFGTKTGQCAFCNLPLSDEKSVYVGYGRECAKTWNLPYKDVKTPKCEEA